MMPTSNNQSQRKPLKTLSENLKLMVFSLNEQVCGYKTPFINELSL
jgi:hypothetical protein